jgi:hypothetical protein
MGERGEYFLLVMLDKVVAFYYDLKLTLGEGD